jgi:hypothetical protein
MKKIKIGYSNYKIIDNDDKKLDGQFIHTDKIITITPSLSSSDRLNTLLHETLHGVWFHWGIEEIIKAKNAEEAIITSIANGLTTVIRDNPEFLPNLNELAQSEDWNDQTVSSRIA